MHEAYLRLVRVEEQGWTSRKHFFDIAAMAMRQLLTDHARRKRTKKRGGSRVQEPLEEAPVLLESQIAADRLVALDEALAELEALNPRHARIVELRFLTGLDVRETSAILNLSERTLRREWAMARAWLHRAIDQRMTNQEDT